MAAYPSTQRLPQARVIVNAPIPHDGGSDRRWLAEEAGAETYFGAFLRMLVHPTKFALAWTQGARAISPLKFVAFSTTVVVVTMQLVQTGSTSTTWLEVIGSVLPTAVFALLGLLIHLAYKSFGSQRSVETSLGLTLYTIAGPGLFFPLVLTAGTWWVKHHSTETLGEFLSHQGTPVMVGMIAVTFALYAWPRIVLGRVLHRVHRRRGWWTTVLAIVFAELCVALMFGTLVQYGVDSSIFDWPRLVISPNLHNVGVFW